MAPRALDRRSRPARDAAAGANVALLIFIAIQLDKWQLPADLASFDEIMRA
jgi:hypothetical protein